MVENAFKINSNVIYPPPPTKYLGKNGVSVDLTGETLTITGSSSINIGDIFYTSRSDAELNGAVTCDGTIYRCSDFSGENSLPALLKAGKIPYISMADYAKLLAGDGFNATNFNCSVNGSWVGGNLDGYILPNKIIPFSESDSWEFNTVLRYYGRIAQGKGQAIIGLSDRAKDFGTFILYIDTTGLLKCFIGSTGTSWDIANDLSTGLKLTIEATHNIAIGFNSDGYYVKYKLEADEEYQTFKIAKTVKCYSNGAPALLNSLFQPLNYYSNSFIDLKRTQILINDTVFWEGGNGVEPVKSVNCFGFDGEGAEEFRVPLIETPRVLVYEKTPTDEDKRWCRLYSDGWLEQGGVISFVYSSYVKIELQFVFPFRDINYTIFPITGHTGDVQPAAIIEKYANGVIIGNSYNSNGAEQWIAYGYINVMPAGLQYTAIGLGGMRPVVQLASGYSDTALATCTSVLPRMEKLENKFQVVNDLPVETDPEFLYFVVAKETI